MKMKSDIDLVVSENTSSPGAALNLISRIATAPYVEFILQYWLTRIMVHVKPSSKG